MVKEWKVWMTPDRGISYRTVVALLFGQDCILPPLGIIYDADIADAEQRGDSSVNLVIRGLARGKGRTRGYHERIIAIPLDVARRLAHPSYSAYLASKRDEQE